MAEEKLQRGGPRRTRPVSRRESLRHPVAAWKRRHAVKKRRLAAMTRRRRILRRFGVLGTWLLALIALVMVVTVVLFYTLTDVRRPEDIRLDQVATILYSDGSVMARIGSTDRTLVTLNQVPEQVRWEVLSAEDRSFYSEPGVSIKGTIRAAVSDVTGGDTQGGSGITQQYVKNAYLSDSRTLTRKLKELMIAVKLSREYSKDQILEYYLNTVYFGRGAYGIQAAAQTYFGVDISKITVAQGAVLAALLRSPGYYDPAENPDAAKTRWTYVLDGMVSTKHLTKEQEDALTYPAVLKPTGDGLGVDGYKALIVEQVEADLASHGISTDEMQRRGLSVLTTITPAAEQAALQAINTTFGNLTAKQRTMKNALAAVNPATGAVLAYYGGSGPGVKNYAGQIDDNDYAGVGSRPPGSSFKPYTLATVLTQTLNKTPGKAPLAINSQYDGSYCVTIQGRQICNDPGDEGVSGRFVSISNAMKYSLNTTFDQLAVEAGPDNVAATAHAAGIAPTDSYGNKTLVDSNGNTGFGIGIGDYAVHPIDQAVGFATFDNKGVYNAPYFVQKATASDGEVLYSHKAAPKQVLDPRVANDVTLTLQPIAASSGDPLAGGRVNAAKTGTEGIGTNTTNNSDAWMVGYTPQVSVAVWVGSGNSTTPIFNANGGSEYGSDLPGKTWARFMNAYLSGQPNLPMATKQQVTGGQNVVSSPQPSPTKSSSAKPSPTPSFSLSTGFSPVPSPTPTLTTPSGLLPTITPSSPPPSPPGSASCTPTIVRPVC